MSHLEDLVAQQAAVIEGLQRQLANALDANKAHGELQAAQEELRQLNRTTIEAQKARGKALVATIRQLAGTLERITPRADLPQTERVKVENFLLELAYADLEGR